MAKSKNFLKSPILALWLTVFIDLLGLGIVIPIFASLFFVPGAEFFMKTYEVWGMNISTSLVYGLLIASYPIAQFFGAPLLGDLSDKYGRKKMLTLSITGTLVGYLVIAWGIVTNTLWVMFLGRLIDGFTGGNISVAQSSISDLSTKKTRTKNFGLIGMAFGLGFVIGPYLGGKLADPTIVSWFSDSTPFLFAGILAGINLILIRFNLKETLKKVGNAKINLLGGVSNLIKAITVPELRSILLVTMLFTFGFNFFTQFFQVYLIDKFHYTQSNIGDLFAYIGIWIAITQGVILRPLSKKISNVQFPRFSLLILGLSFFLLLIPDTTTGLLLVIPFVSIFNGLSQPNLLSIVSGLADETTQGEVLGINQSVRSIAQAIPPIIAGFIASISVQLPIQVAGGVTLLAWIMYIILFRGVKVDPKFKD